MLKKRIALLGDSLTYRFHWADALPDFDVHNFGVDGDGTEDLLARIPQVAATNPRTLFLQIGINDLLGTCDLTGDDTKRVDALLRATTRNHTTIWRTLAQVLPETELHVCSLLPTACGHDPQQRINASIRALNSMLEQAAVSQALPFIDLYGALSDANGALAAEYTLDGVHLSPAAYAVWLDAIRPFL